MASKYHCCATLAATITTSSSALMTKEEFAPLEGSKRPVRQRSPTHEICGAGVDVKMRMTGGPTVGVACPPTAKTGAGHARSPPRSPRRSPKRSRRRSPRSLESSRNRAGASPDGRGQTLGMDGERSSACQGKSGGDEETVSVLRIREAWWSCIFGVRCREEDYTEINK